MNLQCQARYASAADVNTLAALALNANLPAGFEPASSQVTASFSGSPVTDTEGNTIWSIQTQRLLRAHLDLVEAALLIHGRSPAEAGRRLGKSLHLAAAPAIQLTPGWWPWLPVIPFRIAISTSG